MYEKYVSNYYDDWHIESYNLEFLFFVKQPLDELENPTPITEWRSNMDKYSDKKQEKQGKKTTNNK